LPLDWASLISILVWRRHLSYFLNGSASLRYLLSVLSLIGLIPLIFHFPNIRDRVHHILRGDRRVTLNCLSQCRRSSTQIQIWGTLKSYSLRYRLILVIHNIGTLSVFIKRVLNISRILLRWYNFDRRTVIRICPLHNFDWRSLYVICICPLVVIIDSNNLFLHRWRLKSHLSAVNKCYLSTVLQMLCLWLHLFNFIF
jgi:hypothetical protein